MRVLKELMVAARPKQWAKNVIIYFAFFFTINQRWEPGQLGEILDLLGLTTAAFLLFCALSGATYLLNDVADAPLDRNHPRKRHRPIAAGRLSPQVATTAAGALAVGGLVLSFLLHPWFGVVALAYVLLTGTYSFALKRLAIIDVLALSGGYLLRAVAGAVVIEVPISPWLYVVTGLGALLIGFGKRRNELVLAGANGPAAQQREVLQEYSVRLLDQLIAMVAPAILIAYILYTFTAEGLPEDHTMMFTIPFVLYGLFRYLYLMYHRNLGESPDEVLLTDAPLIATVILWLITAISILAVAR